MVNRDYTIDQIVAMTKEQVWELPVGGLRVAFSDKTIVCPTNIIKINWYFWQLYKFGEIQGIDSSAYMGNIDFNGGVPSKELSKIFWEVYMRRVGGFFPGQGLDFVWEMSRRTYQVINELYNDSIFKMASHVSTLDIMDLINVLDAPEVQEAQAKWAVGEMDVDDCHDVTWNTLTSGRPEFHYNEISRGARAKIFNQRQTNQTIGPRAYIPEINGTAFKTPIAPGYISGLESQYDRLIESRTAAIAYFMAKAPLEDSEYNNRMAQFLCSVIRGIEHCDCGTKHTLTWRVGGPKDLSRLRGKFYMKDGQHHMIYGNEKELIGQTLEIRSFTRCESKDPQYPCAICIGWNAWTTPPNTVLGHHLSTEPLGRISQKILSTKHVIASTKPLYLHVGVDNAKFMELDMDNPHLVRLREQENIESVSLRIQRDEAAFLNDVLSVEDPHELIESRISCVTNLQVHYMVKGRTTPHIVNLDVSLGGFGSPLTTDFLVYLKEVSWDVVGTNIIVDMTQWNYAVPIIRTPARGADVMTVLHAFQDFVNSPNKPHAVRASDYNHPGPAIAALMEALSEHIPINFSHAEVFVRALMCRVNESGHVTYEMPRGGDQFVFGSMKDLIHNRSEGTGMAFESHVRKIFSPGTYLKDGQDIPSTSMDYIWSE
ncbi:RNA polymerase beta prime subunit [Vibrio phage C-ZP2022]|nr:RNA polymerase beta prime subunit [Vibrio phage C-ZP2022]